MGGKNLKTPFSSHVRQYLERSLTMAQWKNLLEELEPGSSECDSRLLLILWLGHASVSTTGRYLTTEARLMDEEGKNSPAPWAEYDWL